MYPLTRALYGQRIRQPIGGDFGMSRPLVRHYLAQPVWDTDVARFGIDIWMTTDGHLRRFQDRPGVPRGEAARREGPRRPT